MNGLAEFDQRRVVALADILRESGGVRVSVESIGSSKPAIEREKRLLRRAATRAGVRIKIENVGGYFLRATVVTEGEKS